MKTFLVDHLFRMTDDTGIFQHTRFATPDYSHGYTTDDNARALIVAVNLYELEHEDRFKELIYKYLSFLNYAITSKGTFKNFMDFNRNFIEEEGSEDCFGRCVWAIASVIASPHLPENAHRMAKYILSRMEGNFTNLTYIRAKAYTLIGVSLLKSNKYKKVVEELSADIQRAYIENSMLDWHWFEQEMTYSNAVIPCSLFLAAEILKSEDLLEVGIESFDFLLNKTTQNGYFKAIGCKGWYKNGGIMAAFDEQPVEAGETVYTCLIAFGITKEPEYLDKMLVVSEWFHGRNCMEHSMVDPETGGCYDGITAEGVNYNQGAESIISLLLSETILHKQQTKMNKIKESSFRN
jgi:uncharacterized protein YyaL (SSP411 family)